MSTGVSSRFSVAREAGALGAVVTGVDLAERVDDDVFADIHRAFLDGLRAVHRGTKLAADAGLVREAVTTSHPVVRTHPETGRRSLFVNGNYVTNFDGWTETESVPLLSFLYADSCKPEYTWRHRWERGDLVIWDNRCTQHMVINDVGGQERTLHRITIRGDVAV